MATSHRVWLVALWVAASLGAQVERCEITERVDLLDGREFGAVGAYEKLAGSLHFALDPAHVRNAAIVDLDLAPRDDQGRVHARADFMVLQPKDPERRAGVGLLEISNRGGKGMLARFDFARGSSDPSMEAHFGDGFLLRGGLTLIWIGWQFDVPRRPGQLRLDAPVARSDDGPIRGLVRADWTVERSADRLHIGHRDHVPYPIADPSDEANVLTLRAGPYSQRAVIPRDAWRFSADGEHIELDGGFEAGRIYELVYRGQDPVVVGLGLAAIRDAIAFARHDPDCPFPIEKAVAVGISQSGRFLRHFLWLDFNTDTEGRPVFEGVMSIVAGAGRGSFAHRFAQPSRDGHRLHAFLFPTDLYPFTSRIETDPVTGRREGLIEGRTTHVPKLFQINGGYEYWGRSAASIHTSVDGLRDVEPLDTERIYAISSAQHFDAGLPRRLDAPPIRGNPLGSVVVQRALLAALLDWVVDGRDPPPNRFPRLADGTLVPFADFDPPRIPGVVVPNSPHRAWRADYGPRWSAGIVDQQPPTLGKAFPALVPAVDAFGNERGGIRTVELRAPLATYLPYALHPLFPGEPEPFYGSFVPLPRDDAERAASHDPRPSIAATWPDRATYLERARAAAEAMVEERVLLAEDIERVVDSAGRMWDLVGGR